MKLSVIVPAYNAEKTIIPCIDSILAQTIDDFELIVINDGSSDATEEILQSYSNRYRQTIRMMTVENGGQGSRVASVARDVFDAYFASDFDLENRAAENAILK